MCVCICACFCGGVGGGGGGGVHSLPQHGDLVLDAALFPLQGLFGDALDGEHAGSQLLLGQDHLGERSPVNEHTQRAHVSRQCVCISLVKPELLSATLLSI